jgi:hypothetical protein
MPGDDPGHFSFVFQQILWGCCDIDVSGHGMPEGQVGLMTQVQPNLPPKALGFETDYR